MPEIGVRELKTHASQIIRQLRDQRTRYVVTFRGKPVAVLLPLPEAGLPAPEAGDDPWAELTELGRAISQGWPGDKTGADLLSEMRR